MTGIELKRLRKKLGLTLAMASRQVEVSIATWCRWERAEVVPAGGLKLFLMVNKITKEKSDE
jgi:DNA-binding transcriptional regulator YiaG